MERIRELDRFFDARLSAPVLTADTRYRIASISKMFTAVGIMQQMDLGRLSLDGDAGEYLGFPLRNPDFPDVVITVRMLLTHVSSLRNGDFYNFPCRYGLKEILLPEGLFWENGSRYARKEPGLDVVPGKRFEYSDLNYVLLAAILEKLSGERFDLYERTVCGLLVESGERLRLCLRLYGHGQRSRGRSRPLQQHLPAAGGDAGENVPVPGRDLSSEKEKGDPVMPCEYYYDFGTEEKEVLVIRLTKKRSRPGYFCDYGRKKLKSLPDPASPVVRHFAGRTEAEAELEEVRAFLAAKDSGATAYQAELATVRYKQPLAVYCIEYLCEDEEGIIGVKGTEKHRQAYMLPLVEDELIDTQDIFLFYTVRDAEKKARQISRVMEEKYGVIMEYRIVNTAVDL